MNETDIKYLRLAIEVAQRAKENGNHPFGSLVVDADGKLLLEAENTVITERDGTGHAEPTLCAWQPKFSTPIFWHPARYTLAQSLARCVQARLSGAISAESFLH